MRTRQPVFIVTEDLLSHKQKILSENQRCKENNTTLQKNYTAVYLMRPAFVFNHIDFLWQIQIIIIHSRV